MTGSAQPAGRPRVAETRSCSTSRPRPTCAAKVTEAWREFAGALAALLPSAAGRRARRAHPRPDRVRHRRRRLLGEHRACCDDGVSRRARGRQRRACPRATGWTAPRSPTWSRSAGRRPAWCAGSGESVRPARHRRPRPTGWPPSSPARCATCTARRTPRSSSTSCTTPRTSRSPVEPLGTARHEPRLDEELSSTSTSAGRRPALAHAAEEVMPLDERVRTVVAAMSKTDRRAAAGRHRRRHRHPGRLGDGVRPGPRQPAAGRRLLAGAHRGRADRAALREAVRADQPDADRPALLHQRHGLGVDPGVRPQLPGHPPDARRAGDDRAGRRAGRPAARRVRRQALLRRGRQAGRQASPDRRTAPACTSRDRSSAARARPARSRPCVDSVCDGLQPGVRDRPQRRRRSTSERRIRVGAGRPLPDCAIGCARPSPTSSMPLPVDPQHERAATGRHRLRRGRADCSGTTSRPVGRPVEERVRVELGLGVARAGTWYWASRAGWPGRDTSNSETWVPCTRPSVGGLLADADQPAVAGRVQVRRVAGDLQLAGDRRLGRVAQVDCVERVGLPERHHVPDRCRRTAPSRSARPCRARRPCRPAASVSPSCAQHVHRRAGRRRVAPRASGGGGHPQVTVPFGHRVLVDQPARHRCRRRRRRGRPGARGVELVDLGASGPPAGLRVAAPSHRHRPASAGRWRRTGWGRCCRRCRRRPPRRPGRRRRAPAPARSKVSTVSSRRAGVGRPAG